MAVGRQARREARRTRVEQAVGAAQTEAALDLLELVELAWHDCYRESSPPESVVDQILLVSGGDLDGLAQAARLAVVDRRDLQLAADELIGRAGPALEDRAGQQPAANALRRLLDRAFETARWHVEDLTDGEYFWEPIESMWSVRPRSVSEGWGSGDWVCEDGWPPPDPVPMTTISWRIVHLAAWTDVYRNWTWHDATLGLTTMEVPGSARGAVEWLHSAQASFTEEVTPLTDTDLLVERPAHYGQDVAVGSLIRGIAFEHIHHGAEVGALRDLHRGHARRRPYVGD